MRLSDFAIIVLLALVITSQIFVVIYVMNQSKISNYFNKFRVKQEIRKEMKYNRLIKEIEKLHNYMPLVNTNLSVISDHKKKYGLGGNIAKKKILGKKLKIKFMENWFEPENYFINRIKE